MAPFGAVKHPSGKFEFLYRRCTCDNEADALSYAYHYGEDEAEQDRQMCWITPTAAVRAKRSKSKRQSRLCAAVSGE